MRWNVNIVQFVHSDQIFPSVTFAVDADSFPGHITPRFSHGVERFLLHHYHLPIYKKTTIIKETC